MWVNVLTKYNCYSKPSLYYICLYDVVFSLLPWQSCNHGLVCNYRPHLMDFRTASGFFSILVFSDNMGVPKKINGRSRCALTPSTSKSNTLYKLYDPWRKTCWNMRTAISIKLIEPKRRYHTPLCVFSLCLHVIQCDLCRKMCRAIPYKYLQKEFQNSL